MTRTSRARLLNRHGVTIKPYVVLVIAAIVAAGLTGCASESQYSAQFFKASRSGQISIIQTSAVPYAK
jgi:outer membrane lipoprotein SlyB